MAPLNSTGLFLLITAAVAGAQTANKSYVGSRACFACHSEIYKSFEKTGMGRSMTSRVNGKPVLCRRKQP